MQALHLFIFKAFLNLSTYSVCPIGGTPWLCKVHVTYYPSYHSELMIKHNCKVNKVFEKLEFKAIIIEIANPGKCWRHSIYSGN